MIVNRVVEKEGRLMNHSNETINCLHCITSHYSCLQGVKIIFSFACRLVTSNQLLDFHHVRSETGRWQQQKPQPNIPKIPAISS